MIITILSKTQICDDKKALQIFKKYGTNAAITDFSILLGAGVSNDHTSDSLYNLDPRYADTRAADYWTKTKQGDKQIAISSYSFGYNGPKKIDDRFICIRPALIYSQIKSRVENRKISEKEVLEVEYGKYPQTLCTPQLQMILEKMYKKGSLQETGKTYTTDTNIKGDFTPQKHLEYTYKGEEYIRFVADRDIIRTKLSDKKYIEQNKAYWIKVEPIIWMVDEKENIAITKKLLIAGIPFSKNQENDFRNTTIHKYLNTYFVNEIKTENKIMNEENRFAKIEDEIQRMSLDELQELRFIIENQIKKEVKIKRLGGLK